MSARLLYDNNLPYQLVSRLKDIFPDTNHVYLAGMNHAADAEIWRFARDNNHAIVKKDSDFNDLSILLGAPPKVIWLRVGNVSAKDCEFVLRTHYLAIADFLADPALPLLSITRN